MLVYLSVVDGLPRRMQGEAVLVPWSVCWLGSWLFTVIVPWLLSRLVLFRSRERLFFLAAIFVSALCWNGCGGEYLLADAWRCGL